MTANYYKKRREGPHLYSVYLRFKSETHTDQDGHAWYYFRVLHVAAVSEKEAKNKAKQHIKEHKIKCVVDSISLGTRGIII